VTALDPAMPAIKAGQTLIPAHLVASVDILRIEEQIVYVSCHDGKTFMAEGADAIDIVMQMKPSALEGRRLKWKQGAWAFHNFVAHPAMQILVWLGYKKAAIRLHDRTTPRPRT
jgi:hypothetical protein